VLDPAPLIYGDVRQESAVDGWQRTLRRRALTLAVSYPAGSRRGGPQVRAGGAERGERGRHETGIRRL